MSPRFLEKKLMAEYGPNNPSAVYGTMNKLGAMHGNKETAKGRAMERKHAKGAGRSDGQAAAHASHPNASRLGPYLHPKKTR